MTALEDVVDISGDLGATSGKRNLLLKGTQIATIQIVKHSTTINEISEYGYKVPMEAIREGSYTHPNDGQCLFCVTFTKHTALLHQHTLTHAPMRGFLTPGVLNSNGLKHLRYFVVRFGKAFRIECRPNDEAWGVLKDGTDKVVRALGDSPRNVKGRCRFCELMVKHTVYLHYKALEEC